MLGDSDVMATVAVRDIEKAYHFYVETLGLQPRGGRKGVLTLAAGRTSLLVYQSPFAGTNQATAATWVVGENVEEYVEELRSKGVTFEHYDFPGTRLEGDIHHMGDIKGAWFKDPDGNIFHIVGPENTSREKNTGQSRERAGVGTT